jgi:hypothetical protein
MSKESFMKEAIQEVKTEIKAKLLFWNNLPSVRLKVALIIVFIGLVGLKVFTTVLTFDWISGLFS